MLEHVKKDEKSPVVAAISKPYKTIAGIQRSFAEAQRLFGMASISGASAFTVSEDTEPLEEAAQERGVRSDMDNLIAGAVRRNSREELKETFVQLIYSLPDDSSKRLLYSSYTACLMTRNSSANICTG